MHIRLATITDLPVIDSIYNQAIRQRQTADRHPYSIERRANWFNEHSFPYDVFVVLEAAEIAGWFSFSPYRKGRAAFDRVAEISYYFEHSFQGKGLGTQLLEWAKGEARARSFTSLVAILLGSNRASVKLLEKAGFERWGCLPALANFEGEKLDHLYYGIHLSNQTS
ncbi:MAG TPA: N-acetyltransferase family protein [Ferruginibacter sp.]|nr:N-acetyltransferase family protein [Ferruginibacter sp.]